MNPEELGLAIDRGAEVPVGVQLAWAVRARIEDQTARPGERLPGLREVADATGLNINTVRAVYQRLDQEGLIESRQGSGTFVSDAARAPASAHAIAANAAREARETGVDPRAVAAALYVGSGEPHDEVAGVRRRALREQIAMLERAIGELESDHPGVATPAPRAQRSPLAAGPALLSAGELAAVRAALVRRLASLQAAIDADVIDVAEASASARDAPARRRASSSRPAAGSQRPAAKRAPAKREPARASSKTAKKPRPSARRGPVRPAVAEG